MGGGEKNQDVIPMIWLAVVGTLTYQILWVYAGVYVGLCRSTQVDGGSTWVYVGVYAGLCGGVSLFVLGYHWLFLATYDLVGDNREIEIWVIFWGLVTIITGQWS